MSFFEDLRAADEGVLLLDFWALQVYRLGHLRYRFRSRLVRWLLAAVRVGDDADIGANAVVIRDVPAGTLAVGVPGRIILRATNYETS